jgi:hypothetical protein
MSRVGLRQPLIALLVLATWAAGSAQERPCVVLGRPSKVREPPPLHLPAEPGLLPKLGRYLPDTYRETRLFHFQLLRVLTYATGRWIPDTTSIASLMHLLNRLPVQQQNRVLAYCLGGSALAKGQSRLSRLWERRRVPLIEPPSEGLRLKPVRIFPFLLARYEVRFGGRKVLYLSIPRWRATLYRVRGEASGGLGLWWSFSPKYALSAGRSHGRDWRAVSVAIYRHGENSSGYAQAERVWSPWGSYLQLVIHWDAVAAAKRPGSLR